jgi:hypothetical protein
MLSPLLALLPWCCHHVKVLPPLDFCPAEAEEYVVPAEQLEGGDPQEAFFRVTVLEEELRVMAPDLGAIQVRSSNATIWHCYD